LRKAYGDIDSKFKFVIVASKRAKQLLRGAKPKIKSKSKSLIRIAQQEVKRGMVDYEIVQKKKEEEYRPEDEDFIGEEILKGAEASQEVEDSEEESKEAESEESAEEEVEEVEEEEEGEEEAAAEEAEEEGEEEEKEKEEETEEEEREEEEETEDEGEKE
jgi:DNA-directed RNA polymerase omega subunit